MGTTQADEPFTYTALSEADAAWLRRAADELRVKLRRSVEEVVASGRILAAARRRLGREQWRPWLATQAQIPPRSASRLVNVGTVFATVTPSALANFTPTALYTLAETGVPQSVREYFLQQAAEGEEVTASDVEEMLTLQRDTAPNAPLKLAPVDEEPEDSYVDAAEVFAADNWRVLRELIGTSGTVHLAADVDAESEDDVTFNGVQIQGQATKRATGETLEMVVLKLAGGVRKKVCPRCGENKPLDQYCERSDLPDGREYRCKACERARVKAYTERKKAERGALRKAAS